MDDRRLSNLSGWTATALAAGVLVAAGLLDRGPRAGVRALGVAVLLTAAVLMFAPFAMLRRHGAAPRGRPYYETTRIADRGLYALVRHPQYLGYMLLVLGFAALSQHLVTAVLAALAIALFGVQATAEEKGLRRRFGPAWDTYTRRVPRFNILAGLFRRIRGSETEDGP